MPLQGPAADVTDVRGLALQSSVVCSCEEKPNTLSNGNGNYKREEVRREISSAHRPGRGRGVRGRVPGCISQGKTRAEALENINDAIAGHLESLRKHDEPIPPPIEEEVVEVMRG